MKTSDLTGAALDWAVARCENNWTFEPDGCDSYSTDWAQGGPLIERERFTLMYDDDWKLDPTDPEDNGERWMADNGDLYYNPCQYGATPLIAAMRFYVASKLGDEVDVPKELL